MFHSLVSDHTLESLLMVKGHQRVIFRASLLRQVSTAGKIGSSKIAEKVDVIKNNVLLVTYC